VALIASGMDAVYRRLREHNVTPRLEWPQTLPA
jgi:hypothetical protein